MTSPYVYIYYNRQYHTHSLSPSFSSLKVETRIHKCFQPRPIIITFLQQNIRYNASDDINSCSNLVTFFHAI